MPKIQCNVTKLWYSVTTNHKKELVEKYGSEDELTDTYVCRDARRLRKEGKTDTEINKLAETGVLTSKTSAPKRLGTKGVGAKLMKAGADAKASKVEETEDEVSDEPIGDPDVEAFLAPAGDASNKAV